MDELITAMKVVLGTAFALYVKTHGFHWNVDGIDFFEYHKLFEMMYNEIWESIDNIAEQLRQLDAYAPATMERYIELSRVKSQNDPVPAREMAATLMADNEIMVDVLTEAFHAAEALDRQGLMNFLAGRMEAHNKHRWMLRASAKKSV